MVDGLVDAFFGCVLSQLVSDTGIYIYICIFEHVFFHPLMEGPELQKASQASQNQPMNQLGASSHRV